MLPLYVFLSTPRQNKGKWKKDSYRICKNEWKNISNHINELDNNNNNKNKMEKNMDTFEPHHHYHYHHHHFTFPFSFRFRV